MDVEIEKRDFGRLVPFERWMGRVGLRFVPLWMTPNQVTLISAVLGCSAGAAFWLASFHAVWFAVGAVLLFARWAGDNIDGQVARARNQCSRGGAFLDIFADAVTFAVLGSGLAFASYSHAPIVAAATILGALQYVLTALWMAYARVMPFPAIGPAETSLTMIVVALLMMVVPRELVHVAGTAFSLVDVISAVTVVGNAASLASSGRALFRVLERHDAAAAP